MEQKQFTEEKITERIGDSFDIVERLRREDLERIRSLYTVKNVALVEEHKRLSAKLGVDHPRVQKLAARIQYNQELSKELDAEIGKAAKCKAVDIKTKSKAKKGDSKKKEDLTKKESY